MKREHLVGLLIIFVMIFGVAAKCQGPPEPLTDIEEILLLEIFDWHPGGSGEFSFGPEVNAESYQTVRPVIKPETRVAQVYHDYKDIRLDPPGGVDYHIWEIGSPPDLTQYINSVWENSGNIYRAIAEEAGVKIPGGVFDFSSEPGTTVSTAIFECTFDSNGGIKPFYPADDLRNGQAVLTSFDSNPNPYYRTAGVTNYDEQNPLPQYILVGVDYHHGRHLHTLSMADHPEWDTDEYMIYNIMGNEFATLYTLRWMHYDTKGYAEFESYWLGKWGYTLEFPNASQDERWEALTTIIGWKTFEFFVTQ